MSDGFEALVIQNLEQLKEGQERINDRLDRFIDATTLRWLDIQEELSRKIDRSELSLSRLLNTWPKRLAAIIAALIGLMLTLAPPLERLLQ